MREMFITVLNMSISASCVAVAVIVARFLLKKAPKIFSYMLWGLVLFRLICPISFESIFSALPVNSNTIPHEIIYLQTSEINSGIGLTDNTISIPLSSSGSTTIKPTIEFIISIINIGMYIWIFGIVLVLLYSMMSYIKLKRKVFSATIVKDNIFETDQINSAFVMGVFNPKIYIPSSISKDEYDYIIKHEQSHIKRKDHIIKPIAFLAVTVHWFNPLMWVSFILMTKDMELSCDENVMKHSETDIRASYSESLLSFSERQSKLFNPLAFGESNVKSRIKNVLRYKKPALGISIVAIVIVASTSMLFAFNQKREISAATAIEQLKNSIAYQNDTIKFQLPKDYANVSDWTILVAGRYDSDGVTGSMHFLTTENQEKSWIAGEWYVLPIAENYTELLLEAYLDDNGGQSIEVDLLEYIGTDKNYAENAYKEEETSTISYTESDSEDYVAEYLNDYTFAEKELALSYISEKIKSYESYDWTDYNIVDSKLIGFEKIGEFDDILDYTISLWALEYRLKPNEPENVLLAGGMNMIDGWITEDESMGKPILLLGYKNSVPEYLGELRSGESDFSTYAGQEIAVRVLLERNGLLPKETYKGYHAIVKFLLSTGETCQLLLSQPCVQSPKEGIWCIERWIDGNGNLYYEIPQTDEKISEYYWGLQKKVNNGQQMYLISPSQTAFEYITTRLGQDVTLDSLKVIHIEDVNDFYQTPVSNYIGYISNFKTDTMSFYLDKVEWLTLKDVKRVEQLNISTDDDMPNGFYIYNPVTYPDHFNVTEQTQYSIIDTGTEHKSVSMAEFAKHIEQSNVAQYSPFIVVTKDGYVQSITQQYIP